MTEHVHFDRLRTAVVFEQAVTTAIDYMKAQEAPIGTDAIIVCEIGSARVIRLAKNSWRIEQMPEGAA